MNSNDQSRETLIRLLNARLADAIDLLYQAKQAHWNVTGREFYALHELFEKISDELREHVDDIAERVAQLGGAAEGTIRMASERSSLPGYPRQLSGSAAHIDALSLALGCCELHGEPAGAMHMPAAACRCERVRGQERSLPGATARSRRRA